MASDDQPMKPRSWNEPPKRMVRGVCLQLAARTRIDHAILRCAFAMLGLLGLAFPVFFLTHCGPCSSFDERELWISVALTIVGALAVCVYFVSARLLSRAETPPPPPVEPK
jgi:phage shock protein PspC (stress-responsive transcriptional regulator)